MEQSGQDHAVAVVSTAERLSPAFLTEAARAKFNENGSELERLARDNDVELTPEVMERLDEQIESSKQAHAHRVQGITDRVQRETNPGLAFLFAAGCVVVFVVGLAVGRFLFMALVAAAMFAAKGATSNDAREQVAIDNPFTDQHIQ